MDDGASISISNDEKLFLPASISKVPASSQINIIGVGNNRHKIHSFGIIKFPILTSKGYTVNLLVYGAYTPTVNAHIVCRYDLTTFGKLSSLGKPENILHFLNNNIQDHIKCTILEKRNFMQLSKDPSSIGTVDAIDPKFNPSCNLISTMSMDSQLLNHYLQFLHNNSGHQSVRTIKNSKDTGSLIIDVPQHILSSLGNYFCEDCEKARKFNVRTAPPKLHITAQHPFETLHMDVIDVPKQFRIKRKTNSIADNLITAKRFLLVVDEHSRMSLIEPLQSVEDIEQAFENILDQIGTIRLIRRRQTDISLQENDCIVRYIWSDAARYFTHILKRLCQTPKIKGKNYGQAIITDAPQAEQQFRNGIAESRWRFLKQLVYTSMTQSNLFLWANAFDYANSIANYTSHAVYNKPMKSPYTVIFNKPIAFKHLFAFGSPAIVQLTDQERNIGMTENFQGYALGFERLDKPWSKITYNFHIDDSNTISTCKIETKSSNNTKIDHWKLVHDNISKEQLMAKFQERSFVNMPRSDIIEIEKSLIHRCDEVNDFASQQIMTRNDYKGLTVNQQKTVISNEIKQINTKLKEPVSIPPHGTLTKFKSLKKEALERYNNQIIPSSQNLLIPDITQEEHEISAIQTQIEHTAECYLTDMDFHDLVQLTNNFDEETFHEFISSGPSFAINAINIEDNETNYSVSSVKVGQTANSKFTAQKQKSEFTKSEISKAIQNETINLIESDTILELEPDELENFVTPKNTLDAMVIVSVRKDNTLKARWVARGDRQTTETFRSTATNPINNTTTRLIYLDALNKGIQPKQADVSRAFLSEYLKERLYIRFKKKIYRLNKCLYGLKQASLMFYRKMKRHLEELNFECSNLDFSLFTRIEPDGFLSKIGLLTDDLLFSMRDSDIESTIKYLKSQELDIPEITDIHMYNGLELDCDLPNGIFTINQTVQMNQFLSDLEDKGFNIIEQEILPDAIFLLNMEDEDTVDSTLYLSIVGSLIWFARMTRPDLSHLVAKAATVSRRPTRAHLNILLKACGYLKFTVNKNLKFLKPKDGKLDVTIFSDADWISKEDEYDEYYKRNFKSSTSTSGIIIMVNSTTLFWNSSKQQCIATSAAQAEIIAAHSAMTEANSILNILHSFGYPQTRVLSFIDNNAAITAITSESLTRAYRHLDLRYSNIRELIKSARYHPTYIQSGENLADFLTKPFSDLQMSREKFTTVIDKITGHYYPDNSL